MELLYTKKKWLAKAPKKQQQQQQLQNLGTTDKTAKTSLKNQHLPNGDNFVIIPSHLRSKIEY